MVDGYYSVQYSIVQYTSLPHNSIVNTIVFVHMGKSLNVCPWYVPEFDYDIGAEFILVRSEPSRKYTVHSLTSGQVSHSPSLILPESFQIIQHHSFIWCNVIHWKLHKGVKLTRLDKVLSLRRRGLGGSGLSHLTQHSHCALQCEFTIGKQKCNVLTCGHWGFLIYLNKDLLVFSEDLLVLQSWASGWYLISEHFSS